MKQTEDDREQIVDLYAKTVWRIALSRTGKKDAAEDVFQEVFLRLFRKERVFDGVLTQEGQITGMVEHNACFFFSFDLPIQLSAYAIVNGSDADSPEVSRPNWAIFATNDAEAADAARRGDETVMKLWEEGDLVLLDSGGRQLSEGNNEKSFCCFSQKREANGEYQYYVWYLEYGGYYEEDPPAKGFQAAELELYVDGSAQPAE